MKYVAALCAVALSVGVVAAAHAKNTTSAYPMMGKPMIYTPSSIKWMAGTGDLKGAMVAVLEGDPSKSGPFTIRLKFPAGTKFPAHYHDDTERVTIISGTFWAGLGSKYDADKLMAFPAGSYLVIPAGVRHFAAAKTECVIQLSGNGPFGMHMAGSSSM